MKFVVSGEVTISVSTQVEAESAEEALEIARERQLQKVDSAARHGESCDEVWCHAGELDGEVVNIRAEKEE